MKRFELLCLFNLLAIITSIIVFSVYLNGKNKHQDYVYVDNVRLFNGFNMSKDMSKIHTKKIKIQTKKVDSLYQVFQLNIKAKFGQEQLKIAQQKLQVEDQKLTEIKQNFSTNVTQQVWDRLNNYIEEYGEAHSYKIILGTQGGGNVMYANDATDITNDILNYANGKYEGE